MKTIRFISVEQTEGLSNPKEHDWCVLQLISCRWHKAAQANVNTKEGSEKAESRKRQKENPPSIKSRRVKKTVSEDQLIVTIDFGTTYTRTWDYREKVPTIIAVAGDHGNRETLWGAEVKTGMSSSAWFKIGMAPKLCATPKDDPLLQQAVGKGLMRIPDGHTPQSLCKEFLKHLHAHIMNAVNKEYSGIIETTPVDFVFSAPAEYGKEYTGNLKKAAESAGFRSRLKDKISFIDEPEAAALLAFECYLDKKHSKKNVMVVDMGGGTVVRISLTLGYWEHKIRGGQDLITYEIKSRSPLRVTEACAGTSAMCGGTTIDRELHKLMGEKYGNDFLGKSAKSISQGSDFMKEFEDINCRLKREPGCHYRLLLWMNRESGSGYDAETGTITLTSEEIIAMFDQVIKPSIDKISQQISQLKKQNQNPVQVSDRSAHFEKNHFSDKFARDKQAVVLCGGLGGNVHVFKRIQQFCKSELETRQS
ncbi:Hsp70 family protein [Coccidioides immitis H538.4]|uniref:Hsp70 family protein n=1 Tax=Coccidioides immitis H538.4 TaxID=396776 RepID=A0A0J8RXF1_COCIT|nr:Hsp70 family protein [Coccidioides immitis H538.4]